MESGLPGSLSLRVSSRLTRSWDEDVHLSGFALLHLPASGCSRGFSSAAHPRISPPGHLVTGNMEQAVWDLRHTNELQDHSLKKNNHQKSRFPVRLSKEEVFCNFLRLLGPYAGSSLL